MKRSRLTTVLAVCAALLLSGCNAASSDSQDDAAGTAGARGTMSPSGEPISFAQLCFLSGALVFDECSYTTQAVFEAYNAKQGGIGDRPLVRTPDAQVAATYAGLLLQVQGSGCRTSTRSGW